MWWPLYGSESQHALLPSPHSPSRLPLPPSPSLSPCPEGTPHHMSELGVLGGSLSSATGACAVSSSMVLPSQSPATAVSMPQAAAREALVGRERMLPISSPMACGPSPEGSAQTRPAASALHTPSPPSTAGGAWHWLKHILCIAASRLQS